MSGKRPLVAALLALVYPGLGHVYLRAWFRAAVWAGFAIATAALVVPESAVTALETGGVRGFLDASRAFGLAVYGPLLVVRLLNVLDAYLAGVQRVRRAAEAAAGESCPECGRDLDEDLDFCPWCTARLEPEETEAPS